MILGAHENHPRAEWLVLHTLDHVGAGSST